MVSPAPLYEFRVAKAPHTTPVRVFPVTHGGVVREAFEFARAGNWDVFVVDRETGVFARVLRP